MTEYSAQPDANEKITTAFRNLLIIGLMDGLLSLSLLTCGILCIAIGEGGYHGPPYYTGSLVVGTMFFVKSILLVSLYSRGTYSIVNNVSCGPHMNCISCISFFSAMVCVAEIGLTAMSGAFGASNPQIKYIVITFVVLIVCCLVLSIHTLRVCNSIESNIPDENGGLKYRARSHYENHHMNMHFRRGHGYWESVHNF